MSLLKKIGNVAKSLVRSPVVQGIAGTIFPAARPLIAAAGATILRRPTTVAPGGGQIPALNPVSNMSLAMPALPALATVGRTVGTAVRRYGGTVATVGGAGAILYDAAGNPVQRRRPKSKGITARELKSFTRVTGILNKYCKTPPPMKRRAAGRSKSCR